MYACKILKDSISAQGYRLTTFEVTFPRIILAEVNTHRMLSRNSASSRAIPVHKSIQSIRNDPFKPEVFESNQKGMVGGAPITDQDFAVDVWETAIEDAIARAEQLGSIEVHKSIANRILEPFKWHTAILSATDWDNFFALRTAPDAQPEFRRIAEMMADQHLVSEPRELGEGELHLPLVTEEEINQEALQWPEPYVDWNMWSRVSIGRCARVSYLTHDGVRDLDADIGLYNRLAGHPPHLSPFEHVGRPFSGLEWNMVDTAQSALRLIYTDQHPTFVERMCRQLEYCGNYRGWVQNRAEILNEHDASLV